MKTNLDGFYKTNKVKESEGIWYDITNEAGIKLKRFGGANSGKVKSLHARYAKPYTRLIQNEMLPKEKEEEILLRVFVESSVIDWKGIEIDGEEKEFNVEDCIKVLAELPELTQDLIEFSSSYGNFKEDLGNS